MRTLQTVLWMSLAVGAGVLAAWVLERPQSPPPSASLPSGPAAEGRVALIALRSALARGDLDAGAALVEAVAVEGLDDAVPLLLDLLEAGGGDASLTPDVLRALEAIGGRAGARGLVEIARRYPILREQAATRLSRLDDRPAAPLLARIVEEEQRRGPLARAAVRALGRTRLRQYAPILVELAAEPHENPLRREAVEALGRTAAPEAVEVLGTCLADADARLRRAAIRALGRIRSPRAVVLLEARLARVPAGHEDELIRTALAGLKGTQRSPFQRP